MHPRPKMLITYCRKRRRNSAALASTIPTIVEDAVIQKSKTKSADMDINFTAESACCSGILDEEVITRDEITPVGGQQILVKVAGERSSVNHQNERSVPAMDISTEDSNSSASDTIKTVAHHAEFAKDGYERTSAFGSSTSGIFDGERQSLAEINSSPSRLCASTDEKTEITIVAAVRGRHCFRESRPVRNSAFKRSSRIRKNVELVVDLLLGNAQEKLLFCWDQSHCIDTGFPVVGKRRNKPVILKKLKKLWEKFEPDLPWERGDYDESNTLLLDDSPHKALCNPPNTAVFPNTYSSRMRRMTP